MPPDYRTELPLNRRPRWIFWMLNSFRVFCVFRCSPVLSGAVVKVPACCPGIIMAVLQRELSHARSSQHMKTWLKKWIVGEISIKRIMVSLIEIYICLLVLGWLFSDRLIFQPQPSSYHEGGDYSRIPFTASDRIIIHGRSVGAGIASHLAAKYKVADLIMESPFITAFRVRMVIPVCFRNSRYHKHYANTFNHHQDHC
jgi:hypothetical protein